MVKKMENISEFSTDQVIRSRGDLMMWVQNVARSQGYIIVTKRSKAITKDFISKIVLGCDRGGVARNKDAQTKKINCPFKLIGNHLKAHDGWKLRVVCDEHNHEPSIYMEGHPFVMRLSDKEAQLDVKPRNILPTLKAQNQNNVSSLRTIYNFVQKLGRSRREGRTPMQNVMHILQTKGYNLHYRANMITNELEDLFFIHPTLLKMWQAFPYVVLMDATYKINKYNLPFLEIVGVTSTNKTFSIAFAFMHNEKTSNYIWALTCLKLTINDSFFPCVIVTDRDLALMKACRDVTYIQRYNKALQTTNQTTKDLEFFSSKVDEVSRISNTKCIYAKLCRPSNIIMFLIIFILFGWGSMLKDLYRCGLTNMSVFEIQQQTKSRANTPSYKNTWNLRNVIWTNSYVLLKKLYNHKKPFKDQIFEVLRKRVSVHAMDKILEELHRSKRFVPTPENCGCQLRTCFGLPCAHELVMYVGTGSPIPLDLVDAFWRKLDLTPSISVEYGDLNVDHRMQRFKEIYNNQPDHIKYNYLRRMEEITDPSTNLINEPSVKKNNRGRPKIKRVQHQSQVPHRYSCSDLNQEPPWYSSSYMDLNDDPARHSSFVMGSYEEPIGQCSYNINLNEEPIGQCSYNIDLNEEPIGQCSYQTDMSEDLIGQCSYKIDLNEEPPLGHNSLLDEIPSIFHPYITHIQNVLGDGNCGFRSVAVCLGYGEDQWLYIRQQLLDELFCSYDDYTRVFVGCDEVVTSLSFFTKNESAPT
uniref:MULE transposase domain-containing protein n=1 Tax=Lactuca sativa TaxID=4236 RepID=A0A9R1XU15_LACSA|nr:hypothetical protein LSAT_V11C300129580 [Lactuca sativa]